MFKKAIKYTDNTHFTDSLKITISAVLPFLILMPYKEFTLAFTIAIGAMLTAPVDIPSNLKHRTVGLLVGALLIPLVTLVLCSLHGNLLFFPVFILVIFALGMISVYGHRANMISFTGLLAVSLSFVHDYKGEQLYIHCLMLLIGGLLYLITSLCFYFARPKRYAALQTSECMNLTAEYLKLRADLWSVNSDSNQIIEEQLNIQVKLNEIHENLREYLVRNKANTGNSSNNRKMLVAFTALVEIHEIAISTAFDHKKLHAIFGSDSALIKEYQNLAYEFTSTVQNISNSLNSGKKYEQEFTLSKDVERIRELLSQFRADNNGQASSEGIVMFSNVIHYAEKQIEKIRILERVLTDTINESDLQGRHKDLEKFLTPQHYKWSTLRDNLNFSSTIFRHALRLTLTILIGFVVGQVFNLLNGYWILLTIVVILRPGYGLTKQRSFERVIGTVVGGLIAFGLLYLLKESPTTIAVLTILSMIIGYWFSHTDYKIGVTFITIYVVLIYGILTPNFMDLLTYRIIDTFIGALLAFGANYLLWPSWEFLNVNIHLSKSIKANRDYVKEISVFYNEKGEVTLPYKLARKFAFIEIGNLMSSFQRMIQEPKSKQKYRSELYELAVLNHTLLSSAASIGTYVQSHKTTQASKAFNVVVDRIIKNLNLTVQTLENNQKELMLSSDEEREFEINFLFLKQLRESELKQLISDDEDIKTKMEESQLVIEQLIWMTSLSVQILKVSQKLAYKKHVRKSILN